MCRIDDCERADVYNVEHRVARKEHKCGECCRVILAGEPYEHHSIIADGFASEHKVCSHCSVLAEWLRRDCGGTVTGELIEDIEEHAQEYRRADLGQLAACARAKWMKGPTFRVPYPGIPVPTLPPPITAVSE
jgi:ribosomal protein S27AE